MNSDPNIVSVQCEDRTCLHISHYQKTYVCNEQGDVMRSITQPDKLSLPCKRCGKRILKLVDCSEYR